MSNELSPNEVKTLKALVKGNKPMSRADLRKATGIQKGWSKLLGSSTKEVAAESLEGRKLVKSEKVEGQRGIVYTVTANGKKAVAKQPKE